MAIVRAAVQKYLHFGAAPPIPTGKIRLIPVPRQHGVELAVVAPDLFLLVDPTDENNGKWRTRNVYLPGGNAPSVFAPFLQRGVNERCMLAANSSAVCGWDKVTEDWTPVIFTPGEPVLSMCQIPSTHDVKIATVTPSGVWVWSKSGGRQWLEGQPTRRSSTIRGEVQSITALDSDHLIVTTKTEVLILSLTNGDSWKLFEFGAKVGPAAVRDIHVVMNVVTFAGSFTEIIASGGKQIATNRLLQWDASDVGRQPPDAGKLSAFPVGSVGDVEGVATFQSGWILAVGENVASKGSGTAVFEKGGIVDLQKVPGPGRAVCVCGSTAFFAQNVTAAKTLDIGYVRTVVKK